MTHLESVWTMALSWVLVPAVVALVCAGVVTAVGHLVAILASERLR